MLAVAKGRIAQIPETNFRRCGARPWIIAQELGLPGILAAPSIAKIANENHQNSVHTPSPSFVDYNAFENDFRFHLQKKSLIKYLQSSLIF